MHGYHLVNVVQLLDGCLEVGWFTTATRSIKLKRNVVFVCVLFVFVFWLLAFWCVFLWGDVLFWDFLVFV